MIELPCDRTQILSIVAKVGADNGCLRVGCDDSFQLSEQIFAFWELIAAKEPAGVLVQFMPPFIELVKWSPEGRRVGGMNDNRATVLATDLPNLVQLRIIDGNQTSSGTLADSSYARRRSCARPNSP